MRIVPTGIPAGTVLAFAGTVAPSGFLICDGSTISRSTYAGLFSVIGTVHGSGNGTTTFHLPDYRGRFLRGIDGGTGRDPDRASRTSSNAGGSTGDNVGSVQGDAYKAHKHKTGGHNYLGGRYGGIEQGGSYAADFAGGAPGSVAPYTSTDGSNENRPQNANVNYIIKV